MRTLMKRGGKKYHIRMRAARGEYQESERRPFSEERKSSQIQPPISLDMTYSRYAQSDHSPFSIDPVITLRPSPPSEEADANTVSKV